MKKSIYSVSDFAATAAVSTIIEDSWWAIDVVEATNSGEYSNTPLFKVWLKTIETRKSDAPEGYIDCTSSMRPSRMYIVREGRDLYSELYRLWKESEGDEDLFMESVASVFQGRAYQGHVERLGGVTYTKMTRRKVAVEKTALEVWYPQGTEEGTVLSDFVFLCNKGTYKPKLDETPKPEAPDEKIDLSKLSPEMMAILKAMMK